MPGEVWLTETNGIVKFGDSPQFAYSRPAPRAHALDVPAGRPLRLAARRPALEDRGLFVYTWFGAPPGARFDAGLVDPDGSPRPAYYVVRRHARAR